MTTLDNRRRRLLDIYETGEIELAEFRKRVSVIEEERASVAAMMDGSRRAA